MQSCLELLLQKGSKSVQFLFSWYLFVGFEVNRLLKDFEQALFLHLNMKIKDVYFIYI